MDDWGAEPAGDDANQHDAAPADSVQFAPIEYLDPEPPPRTGRLGARERLLGLLLLAALLGAGGWQWLSAQQGYNAYHAGAQAAARHDWDAAAAAYRAAGPDDDAPARARDAAATAVERDQTYARASAAAQAGDWATVLEAVARIRQIAPHWRNSEALDGEADDHLATAALSGTVTLRPAASPPGLYAYVGGLWAGLSGSDATSRVLTYCPNGDVIYDGLQVDPGAPLKLAGPQPGDPGGRLGGRRLLRAAPGAPPTAEMGFAAAAFPMVRCTAAGVWGINYSGDLPALQTIPFPSYAMLTVLQPPDGQPLVRPQLPGPGWFVQDIAPDGRTLLVIDATAVTINHRETRLALAAPDGHIVRTFPPQAGTLRWWDFTADGHYLLAGIDDAAGGLTVTTTAWLYDLGGSQPPRALAAAAGLARDLPGPSPLGWDVVRQGTLAGQIILNWADGPRQHVRVVDPARRAPLLDTTLSRAVDWLHILPAPSLQDGVLLGGELATPEHIGPQGPLVYLDATDHLRELAAPVPDGFVLTAGAVGGGRLAYVSGSQAFNPGARSYAVESIPWPPGPDRAPSATQIFSGTLPGALDFDTATPWHLGPGLLTYVNLDGSVQVRTFDGAFTTQVARGLGGFFDLARYQRP